MVGVSIIGLLIIAALAVIVVAVIVAIVMLLANARTRPAGLVALALALVIPVLRGILAQVIRESPELLALELRAPRENLADTRHASTLTTIPLKPTLVRAICVLTWPFLLMLPRFSWMM